LAASVPSAQRASLGALLLGGRGWTNTQHVSPRGTATKPPSQAGIERGFGFARGVDVAASLDAGRAREILWAADSAAFCGKSSARLGSARLVAEMQRLPMSQSAKTWALRSRDELLKDTRWRAAGRKPHAVDHRRWRELSVAPDRAIFAGEQRCAMPLRDDRSTCFEEKNSQHFCEKPSDDASPALMLSWPRARICMQV